jgi:hypothetical protein
MLGHIFNNALEINLHGDVLGSADCYLGLLMGWIEEANGDLAQACPQQGDALGEHIDFTLRDHNGHDPSVQVKGHVILLH